jgi:hypothetical protein
LRQGHPRHVTITKHACCCERTVAATGRQC